MADQYLKKERRSFPRTPRAELLLKWAKEACELFTWYCNGECYYYRVEINGEDKGACGGYWGNDLPYLMECVRDTLEHEGVTALGTYEEIYESCAALEVLALQHS